MTDQQTGLQESEVITLQQRHGFNELPLRDRPTALRTLLQIVTEPMFSLLLGAALIYLMIGSADDALMLSVFIAISIAITFFQQQKSQKALEALRELASPQATVIRGGLRKSVPSRDLVVGDLLLLEEGNRIGADAVLIGGNDFLVDESLLTGESEPTGKRSGESIYSGTMVVRGSGIARVEKIGMATEVGKIGASLGEITDQESPLQTETRLLIKRVAVFGVGLSLLVFLADGILFDQWLDGALTGISLTMALLPEEFTVILTVFMALGIWRISRQRVLVRKTSVIETLGSITTLCVDKTGTLTLNKMSLEAIATTRCIHYLDSPLNLDLGQREVLLYASLASEAEPFDPMEKAFLECERALDNQYGTITQTHVLAHEYGLSAQRPAMTHVWRSTSSAADCLVAIKGSPEAVMGLCHLTPTEAQQIESQINQMASKGLRVLGVAKARYTSQPGDWPGSVDAFDSEWLGLTGLKDPLRQEVPESIRLCKSAGIRIIMITGDHAITAKVIATQAGIVSQRVISGTDIEQLTDLELQEVVKEASIFVRVRPNQKLRLVRALQANGEVVAMTGDGVNDAPALKAAHAGISMGGRGTDVAREASAMVLLNDDFSSIVHAIREGRRIYDNLQKAVMYVIAVHIPIAGAVFIPLLLGLPPMLSPIHILFLEMIIDPSCAVVFESEKPEANLMNRPPRDPDQRIFKMQNLSTAVLQGVGLMLVVVGLYIGLPGFGYSSESTATIAFGSLILGNLLLIVVNRSKTRHFISILRIPNTAQYWIFGLTMIGFLLATQAPFFQERFGFSALTFNDAVAILTASLVCLVWYEIVKVFFSNNRLDEQSDLS